jgi:hypothetical protein
MAITNKVITTENLRKNITHLGSVAVKSYKILLFDDILGDTYILQGNNVDTPISTSWFNVKEFGELDIVCVSNQAGQLVVEFSPDTTNIDDGQSVTLTTNDIVNNGSYQAKIIVNPVFNYMRIKYIPSATADDTFRIYCLASS